MYIHNFNPILINLGFIEIRWYSIAYITGILIGWWLGKKILTFKIKTQKISVSNDDFDDLISYIILGIIIGGRLGYILFYNLIFYINNPINILKIWEGGMSFHGAVVGVIFMTYVFAKQKKTNVFIYLDIIAAVSPIGLFFGRVANFINSELYGNPSNVLWSVIFQKIDNVPRHPSQLYEACLEGVVLFIILIFISFNSKIKNGLISVLFLILYGLFRIFSEQFREPDIQIGYLFNTFSMGTFLSFIMILSGFLIILKKKDEIFK
jgi:phosphatidylglycerol:prolipoprotein diacylglycerol transferase